MWSEIDFETATWSIPGERMKGGRAHRVPLSSRAVEVLQEAQALGRGSQLVFPSMRNTRLARSVLTRKMRLRGFPGTVHGLRSSFRDSCGERGIAREIAEASLAHIVRGVEGAYARSDLLERRRAIMEEWGAYRTSVVDDSRHVRVVRVSCREPIGKDPSLCAEWVVLD